MIKLAGKTVSDGIGFGKAFVIKNADLSQKKEFQGEETELESLKNAIDKTNLQLEAIYKKAKKELGEEDALIIDVQKTMLYDPEFISQIENEIKGKKAASEAVQTVGENMASIFQAMDDEYMKARSTDIKDISDRITKNILGIETDYNMKEDSIVFGHEITPGDTLSLDTTKIKGIVSKIGSNTSHSAILARNLGVPCIINVDELDIEKITQGEEIALDGGTQYVYFNPTPQIKKALKKLAFELAQKHELLLKLKDVPA
ncbi:MAG: hypothetical protein LBB10_01210, partial [Bifidobacteriaceae bacterium]|nr:hypothetical protein [Bifidobacteriaceae bacterium]